MTSVRRALALSFAERYILIAIALLGNILVARLLTPKEIGIYSVSLAVIGVAQVLRDFGIGSFLIQEKNLTEAHIRTAFGFTLLIGGSLFFVVYLTAPFTGSFYGESQMAQTMRISALNFLILPFCSISLTLLRRVMAFKQLVTVSLAAATVGFATTTSLAYAGFGPNSMAIGAVVGNISTGIGAWFARTDRKFLMPSLSEWRALLNFGGQSALSSVVTTIAMDINDLALGKILGFAPVAMISRAQGLMNLFHRDMMIAIKGVAFPAFAKAHREGESLEERYIASVTAVTVIAWPFYGFASLYALELLRLLFGPQWDEAASLVPLFCLAGASLSTSSLITGAMMAVGRIDLVTKLELLFQPLRAVLIIAIAMIFQSLFACAMAFLIAFMLYTPFAYMFKARCIPNDYQSLLSNLWLSAKVTLASLALPAGLAIHVGLDRSAPANLSVLISAAILCGVSWLVALVIFKHPVTDDPLFVRVTRRLPCFA
jgi:lipopolysaccharide exporter